MERVRGRFNPTQVGIRRLEVKIAEGNAEHQTPGTKTISARWVVDGVGVAASDCAAGGVVETEYRTSHNGGVGALDGCERLGRRRAGEKEFPEVVGHLFWCSRHGHESSGRARLVGVDYPAQRRRCQRGRCVRPAARQAEGGSLGQRLGIFLVKHPVGREIMGDAQWRESDVHWRKNLPYYSTTFAGDGFVIVGDAGAFIDPFYEPEMDWVAFSRLVRGAIDFGATTRQMEPLVAALAGSLPAVTRGGSPRSTKDKYEYMGDLELMRVAFLMDLGLYYLGVASQPFRPSGRSRSWSRFPRRDRCPFTISWRFTTGGFGEHGAVRRRRGTWGRANNMHRMLVGGFTFSPKLPARSWKAMGRWLWLESRKSWRSWFAPKMKNELPAQTASAAVPSAPGSM